jgi:hypothetical protein
MVESVAAVDANQLASASVKLLLHSPLGREFFRSYFPLNEDLASSQTHQQPRNASLRRFVGYDELLAKRL